MSEIDSWPRNDGSLSVKVGPYVPCAHAVPIQLDQVVRPDYGHFLEDFVPGRVFVHPRGVTLTRAGMLAYATTFMEANPLYLNEAFARSQGYDSLPAAPHMVMNLALSLGVQNDSEKAIANLGYYDMRFLRPVYAGTTLLARSRVVDRRDRGAKKPGIVTVDTVATNDEGQPVLQYRRNIFVPRKSSAPMDDREIAGDEADFPYCYEPVLHIPVANPESFGPDGVTTAGTLLDAFVPGRIIIHPNGRTITDEHIQWTYRVMNTHPLHYDRLYSTRREGPMSGEPIVYGGLVFAWLLGLASRDATENAMWELGCHDGYHTQPTFSGDTISAISRVLSVRQVDTTGNGACDAGVVRMQLIGVKNVRADEAVERFGEALFELESGKRAAGNERITEKIFEIEREVLIRRHLP